MITSEKLISLTLQSRRFVPCKLFSPSEVSIMLASAKIDFYEIGTTELYLFQLCLTKLSTSSIIIPKISLLEVGMY
jgi:hypothetical protein